jgi:sugar lactone lactonase YvrE
LSTAACLVQAQGTQAPCDVRPDAELLLDWPTSLENLAFDGAGHLYLSDVGGDQILVVGPDGVVQRTLDVPAHGLVWGPDERLYAVVTSGDTYDVQRSTDARVSGFETYTRGISTYNGMAFDAAGNLFVSDDNVAPPAQPPDLIRVPASNPLHWEPWTDVYGPNGLAFDARDGSLYTVITADQSSPVLRLSTTDPSIVEVVAYLSFGAATLGPGAHEVQGNPLHPVPKGLDDLALAADGRLYMVGHLSGELLRVDPSTGDACLLASGLEEPTSVRVAHGFGAHDGKLAVTTWGGIGITGIALGQVEQHPRGKVWLFDVGLPPPSAQNLRDDAAAEGADGREAPLGAVALPALGFALARRR